MTPPPAVRRVAGRRTWSLVLAAGLGTTVGLLGTVAHRGAPPLGVSLALLATLSGAVLARAIAGWLALGLYGGGLLLSTQLASQVRPGGDILVANDAFGFGWLFGSILMVAVAAFLPGRWFARRDGE